MASAEDHDVSEFIDQVVDILCACALRFDGWKHKEETSLDLPEIVETFSRTGKWIASTQGKLAIFFLLQRGLYKWDLEGEAFHGKYQRAFRSLFFEVYDNEVPVRYRLKDRFWATAWETRYRPHLAECVEMVRLLHEGLIYDDNAGPHQDLPYEAIIKPGYLEKIQTWLKTRPIRY